jgi:hypothetical protein
MANPMTGPSALLNLSRDMLAAQQKLLSNGNLLQHVSETAQLISRAQISFGQAIWNANAVMFGAWFTPVLDSHPEEGPSAAARESEFRQD